MKRLEFCFNLKKKQTKKKNKENIALLENKKFGRGCFMPSEHILYLNFFPPPNHDGCDGHCCVYELTCVSNIIYCVILS